MASSRTAKRKAQRRALKHRLAHPKRLSPHEAKLLRLMREHYTPLLKQQLESSLSLYSRVPCRVEGKPYTYAIRIRRGVQP